ncbi:DUF2304 domain-containing protein [Paenibacillus polymyxa]|uniref:DUF2304 domain-containing protein n=1 Tax=Paenibacillus polymyxa TaxID=1406 RepID=UPI0004728A12|nr:DUF2304 domain-containing protein [Paenibacillus polymyxa]WDZ55121.1 DUF2304 domain-containing protein [Paenibacillus polymyxa]
MINNMFFALIGLVLVVYFFVKVKKNVYFESESFFWIFGAMCVFVLSIFPQFIDYFSSLLNISYPPSLLFLLAIIFIYVLLFRQSQQLSDLNGKFKELVEINALLEEKLRLLEKE